VVRCVARRGGNEIRMTGDFKAVLDHEIAEAQRLHGPKGVPGIAAWERIIAAFKGHGGPECLIPAMARRDKWCKNARRLALSDEQASYEIESEIDDAIARNAARPRYQPPSTTRATGPRRVDEVPA
jgi:hypothetical protein